MRKLDALRKQVGSVDYQIHLLHHQNPEHYQVTVITGIPEQRKHSKIYKTAAGSRKAYNRLIHSDNPERLIKLIK